MQGTYAAAAAADPGSTSSPASHNSTAANSSSSSSLVRLKGSQGGPGVGAFGASAFGGYKRPRETRGVPRRPSSLQRLGFCTSLLHGGDGPEVPVAADKGRGLRDAFVEPRASPRKSKGLSTQLYYVLVMLCRERALDKLHNSGENEGLEAYRQLYVEYNPRLNSRYGWAFAGNIAVQV